MDAYPRDVFGRVKLHNRGILRAADVLAIQLVDGAVDVGGYRLRGSRAPFQDGDGHGGASVLLVGRAEDGQV